MEEEKVEQEKENIEEDTKSVAKKQSRKSTSKGKGKLSEKKGKTTASAAKGEEDEEKKITKRPESLTKKTEKLSGAKSYKKTKKEADDDKNVEETVKGKASEKNKHSEENMVLETPKKGNKSSVHSELAGLDVRVDDHSYLKHSCRVYIKGKTIYDKQLIQKNLKKNTGKFYFIQLLRSTQCPDIFYVYDRGGKIGEAGKDSTSKPLSEVEAIQEFEKKLHEMSAKGDYVVQEVTYVKDESAQKQAELKASVSKSKLHPSVASLLSVIFDLAMINKQLSEAGFEIKKIPISKLSTKSITEGYEILGLLAENVKAKATKAKLEELTADFYKLIPHENENIILDTEQRIKEKIELLDSLKEAQIAFKLCEKQTGANAVDHNYKMLKCELSYVEPKSKEYTVIEEYIKNTQEFYNFEIVDLFSLSRDNEEQRFKTWKARGNRMLLWYGSRLTNFVGILSQGLRLPCPEVPNSAFRVGKGIYLTDMISKAHNQCFSYASGGEFCVLLCEAALGEQHELLHDNLNMHEELPHGKHSVLALGHKAPPKSSYVEIEKGLKVPKGKPENTIFQQSSFIYNEYLCYNPAQVRLRYLLRMRTG